MRQRAPVPYGSSATGNVDEQAPYVHIFNPPQGPPIPIGDPYAFTELEGEVNDLYGVDWIVVSLKNDLEKSKEAAPLVRGLQAMIDKYQCSVLILAHTPKRDLSKPITRNDLQGSKMLINFCDSSFSIGESHSDKNLRYLKQIKQRNTEQIYDAENVCVCQIDKPFNFLLFEFVNFGKEWEHLKQHTKKDKENLIEKVSELNQQGRSLREIGSELGISHMKVSRILKECNTL